ncbi:D-isomer specific 2-hydroxyacid dehydrogenase [Caballeronia choica]|jgi:phosphoglycerate dehydrogenase-like enzyme|uniref:D-isomer specific 2-hydroxyacid dehydrogenase n=1 Tax=Caballeronia choica TaxID=326476 RepID=A0A158F858_9BURK|nr:D-2-hydroxyacid dehydrogenase family protein [Caballeronia choica]SAL15519.1 D-isomer specific 2-hydroxyacid dehydrogenase [Caballeronia choica]
MNIALLDDYQNVAMKMADWNSLAPRATVTAFPDHLDGIDALAERLHPFDAVMLMRERTRVPRALLERLPNLKLLITAAMWNASVDIDAATERGIQVCGTDDLPTPAAEMALGLMLALARAIPQEERAIRAGRWQTTLGVGLNGKTLGVIGLGNLGRQMAGYGKVLGMKVLAWSQNLSNEAAAAAGAQRVNLDVLLAESDVVSIHSKLSERTRGLLGARELSLMRPTAYLVNTARGPIVDQTALLAALAEKRIGGAALDVFDVEPMPVDHPFLALENVVLAPHVGYVTEENYRLIYGDVLEDIVAFLDGKLVRPLNTLS